MKSIKILLGAVSIAAAMSLPAFAGDLQLVFISNGHGQSIPVYRDSTPTIAVYAGGSSAGTVSNDQGSQCQGQCSLQTIDRGQGKSVMLYRQCGN